MSKSSEHCKFFVFRLQYGRYRKSAITRKKKKGDKKKKKKKKRKEKEKE